MTSMYSEHPAWILSNCYLHVASAMAVALQNRNKHVPILVKATHGNVQYLTARISMDEGFVTADLAGRVAFGVLQLTASGPCLTLTADAIESEHHMTIAAPIQEVLNAVVGMVSWKKALLH